MGYRWKKKQVLCTNLTVGASAFVTTGITHIKDTTGAVAVAFRIWRDNGAAGDRTIDQVRLRPSWDGATTVASGVGCWYNMAHVTDDGDGVAAFAAGSPPIASVAGIAPNDAMALMCVMEYGIPCPWPNLEVLIHTTSAGSVDLTKVNVEAWILEDETMPKALPV